MNILALKDKEIGRVANRQKKLRGKKKIVTIALDRLPGKQGQKILCFYVNTTRQMQVARISNIPNEQWEHVVFPGERFLFEAIPDAELEIYQTLGNDEIRCERLLCKRLKVNE